MDPSGSTVQVPSPGTTSSLPSSESSGSSSSSVIPVMTTVSGTRSNSFSLSFSSNKCPGSSLSRTSTVTGVPKGLSRDSSSSATGGYLMYTSTHGISSSGSSGLGGVPRRIVWLRSEEHTSELQSRGHLVCRLLLEKQQ